jgi:hypothetical protein
MYNLEYCVFLNRALVITRNLIICNA